MKTKEWLKLNPNHRIVLDLNTDGNFRATLEGGEGIDQRLVGDGVDGPDAIRHALENRERIKATLP